MDVLIIDDDPVLLEILWAVVRKAFDGANSTTVDDLEAAFRWLQRHKPPDLVLLDLVLPGHTGLDSLLQFRARFSRVPVVVVSVVEDPKSVGMALEAGALGFIPKSTPPDLMVAALRQIATGATYNPLSSQ